MLAFVLPALLHFRRKDRGDATRGAEGTLKPIILSSLMVLLMIIIDNGIMNGIVIITNGIINRVINGH